MLCFGVRCSRPSEPPVRRWPHERAFGRPNASWRRWTIGCCRTLALVVRKSAASCAMDGVASLSTRAFVLNGAWGGRRAGRADW